VAIGDSFDIHGNIISSRLGLSKHKMPTYMATIQGCQEGKIRNVNHLLSEKEGTSA
jgi:hypothetical protein